MATVYLRFKDLLCEFTNHFEPKQQYLSEQLNNIVTTPRYAGATRGQVFRRAEGARTTASMPQQIKS